MKNILFIILTCLLVNSCAMNPSKEARIQKLEKEVQQTSSKIIALESTIQKLVIKNEQLTTTVQKLQNNAVVPKTVGTKNPE